MNTDSLGDPRDRTGPPEICRLDEELRSGRFTEQEANAALDEIFFEASGTKHFDGAEDRLAFRERWLGRYLAHDRHWFYLALSELGEIAGYLAGSLDDPARTRRFADIGYFSDIEALTEDYPAHLHVNLAPRFRSRGWGERLIERFVADAARAGAPGVHVVTGRGVRNVRFYVANGFSEVGVIAWRGRELVVLGRKLRPGG